MRKFILSFVARAHLRAPMTGSSCVVGLRNAILKNHFKPHPTFIPFFDIQIVTTNSHGQTVSETKGGGAKVKKSDRDAMQLATQLENKQTERLTDRQTETIRQI